MKSIYRNEQSSKYKIVLLSQSLCGFSFVIFYRNMLQGLPKRQSINALKGFVKN